MERLAAIRPSLNYLRGKISMICKYQELTRLEMEQVDRETQLF